MSAISGDCHIVDCSEFSSGYDDLAAVDCPNCMFLSGYRTSGDVHIGSTVILIAVARNYSHTCRGFEISSSHFEITAVHHIHSAPCGYDDSAAVTHVGKMKAAAIDKYTDTGIDIEFVSR